MALSPADVVRLSAETPAGNIGGADAGKGPVWVAAAIDAGTAFLLFELTPREALAYRGMHATPRDVMHVFRSGEAVDFARLAPALIGHMQLRMFRLSPGCR